jgi:hypothetical protein
MLQCYMLTNKINNKQQTAVDWQFDQLSIENLLGIFTHDQLTRVMEILEQAKEMEKEQIVDAWISDRQFIIWSGDKDDITDDEINELANDYYNETYGDNK